MHRNPGCFSSPIDRIRADKEKKRIFKTVSWPLECLIVGESTQCNCSLGYVWSDEVCYNYQCCRQTPCNKNISHIKPLCVAKAKGKESSLFLCLQFNKSLTSHLPCSLYSRVDNAEGRHLGFHQNSISRQTKMTTSLKMHLICRFTWFLFFFPLFSFQSFQAPLKH